MNKSLLLRMQQVEAELKSMREFDEYVREFIKKNPPGTVVDSAPVVPMDLAERIKTLENQYQMLFAPVVVVKTKTERGMCPKCGVKPNHFFHVKNCTGQKEEKTEHGDEQRRDPGVTGRRD